MLNREKYAKEIIDIAIGGHSFGIANGKPVDCESMCCWDCKFISTDCIKGRETWANAEYAAPLVDWTKVAVDTPILVRNSEIEPWRKRYYAGPGNRSVYAWNAGATSWNAEGQGHWKYAKLAESEDANVHECD